MHGSFINTVTFYLVPPVALLLISLRRESSRGSKTVFATLAFGFTGIYVALASVSFFWATHPRTEAIGLGLAAIACLAAGLLKWFRHSKENDTYPDGTPPDSRFVSLNRNKWNVLTLCYMAIAIGLFVCFHKRLIVLSASSLHTLWAAWGLLLLVGVEQVGGILLKQNIFIRPSAGNWKRYLLQPLVVLGRLAGMLVPLLIFPLRKYLDKITARNQIRLSKRHALQITLTWFAWGTLGGILSGIYQQQAVSPILFGTILIAPALIGAARFAGIVDD